MRTVGGILGGLLLGAQVVAAATWTCSERTEILSAQIYLVFARCTATGTYTTGGDPFGGGGPPAELCNSAQRNPILGLPSTVESATSGQGYVVAFVKTTGRIGLLTAGNSPGPGTALVELAGGTAIDGATFVAVTLCK